MGVMTMEIMTHLKGVTKTRRTSLVTTVACMGISELTAGRRRNLMIKRSRTIIKMILKATLRGKVCIKFFICTESLFTTTFLNSWVVDSGSTSHIARDNKSFTSMQTIPRGNRYVYLGTNAKADILGIGNYIFKLPGGGKLLLKDTLYSSSMRRNLISVSQLE